MNSRQLQYAILLAQTKNFSQVAEKLSISQPALSKQILALEHELGVKLFDRSSTPLALTPAGEHFIAQAESLLYKENQLLRSMEQFRTGEAGTLTIGITPFRSACLIADLLPKIREAFPHIRIHLQEEGGDTIRKSAAEGKYDLAIVNLPVDDSVLDIHPLEPDHLVLVVPDTLLSSLPESDPIRFKHCRNLPFAVVGASQEMRLLFDKLCAHAGFIPNIAIEAVNLTTVWTAAQAGVAAAILPMQFIAKMPQNGMSVLEIDDATYIRQPVVVTRRDQVMTPAAQYALDILSHI